MTRIPGENSSSTIRSLSIFSSHVQVSNLRAHHFIILNAKTHGISNWEKKRPDMQKNYRVSLSSSDASSIVFGSGGSLSTSKDTSTFNALASLSSVSVVTTVVVG